MYFWTDLRWQQKNWLILDIQRDLLCGSHVSFGFVNFYIDNVHSLLLEFILYSLILYQCTLSERILFQVVADDCMAGSGISMTARFTHSSGDNVESSMSSLSGKFSVYSCSSCK